MRYKGFKFLQKDNFIPFILLLFCIIGLILLISVNKYGEVIIDLEEFREYTLPLILTVSCGIAIIPLLWLFLKEFKK